MKKFVEFIVEFFIFILYSFLLLFIAIVHYSHCEVDKKEIRRRRIRKMRLFWNVFTNKRRFWSLLFILCL